LETESRAQIPTATEGLLKPTQVPLKWVPCKTTGFDSKLDIMAEVVVGVIASGISIGTLAAQITSSIIKLKSYWDQVQDAPEDIRDLIEELEDLNQLLIDIEEDQRQNPMSNLILDPNSSSRCLQHCKQGATRLKELTDSLSEDIQGNSKAKRKWASVKLVLKKDKIDRYRTKLQRVVSLLTLSHQIYTRSVP